MDHSSSRTMPSADRELRGGPAIASASFASHHGSAIRNIDQTRANCFEASILRRNLFRVFSEADPVLRSLAICALWTEAPVLYEEGAVATGRRDVSRAAQRFLDRLAGSTCMVSGPVVMHRGLCLLRWHAEWNGGRTGLSGCQIAVFSRGRIDSLFALEDDDFAMPAPH